MKRNRIFRWSLAALMLWQLAACSMTTSPLHSHIKGDQVTEALNMISRGDAINDRDQMGYTPLHLATIKGNSDIAQALVKQRADINARDFHGRTPFMLALREGRIDMAKYFLGQGAQLKTNYTLTNALFDAVTGGSIEMTEYLLQHGFPINTVNRTNTSALHIAATTGNTEQVALLLRQGADVNIRDNSGWSALHFAAAKQHREIIRTLLAAGAQPTPVANDALGAYASGVVYEEAALKVANNASGEAKRDYLIAADHFAKAAAFYQEHGEVTQDLIEAQHAKNALALVGGAFAMAIQPGTSLPSGSGGTVRFYAPVIVPQGSVDSLEAAQAAYRIAKQDALAAEKRCRDAADRL